MSTNTSTPKQAPSHSFAVLKIFINPENKDLIELYKEHISAHNQSIDKNAFPNSGFDIFVPNPYIINKLYNTNMISMDIKAEMVYYNALKHAIEYSPYYMYPRSSISKTPLMLANHTGIIDSGYRGWLIGAFRCLFFSEEGNQYTIEKHTRLLQICHPSLCPIHVVIVEKESDLTSTERGDGGFGSTGVVGATESTPVENEHTEE
jgi:dUTP pyrophosphatase